MAGFIHAVQSPPFDKVGVIDLETFYPARERFTLAMKLNNLIASPGFAAWMEGESLDVGSLLYTRAGKPRLSILSIAHLSDSERMFFVTILLNEVLAWIRTQPGTSSLRACSTWTRSSATFPPTANPPSKRPMLTLLKQARAFGLGMVLATQNPVDLDYKGLSNAGTWFLGRLQTKRDKERVLEGLEGASNAAGHSFDRRKMDETAFESGQPRLPDEQRPRRSAGCFQTRWVMSYLRGPLTARTDPNTDGAAQSGSVHSHLQPGPGFTTQRRDSHREASKSTTCTSNPASSPASIGGRPVMAPDVPGFYPPPDTVGRRFPVALSPCYSGCCPASLHR